MTWNTQPKTARVEKAQALNGIYLYTPYDPNFVDQLKSIVPHELRLWENDLKRWYVFELWAEQAVELARRYWPNLIDNRARQEQERRDNDAGFRRQQERARGQWNASVNVSPSSDHAALCVTSDAPPEVIKAAYKALAILYHPDTGGSVTKMQSVNDAYTRLKKAGKV